jgi:hypothetical protein
MGMVGLGAVWSGAVRLMGRVWFGQVRLGKVGCGLVR